MGVEEAGALVSVGMAGAAVGPDGDANALGVSSVATASGWKGVAVSVAFGSMVGRTKCAICGYDGVGVGGGVGTGAQAVRTRRRTTKNFRFLISDLRLAF